MPSIQGSSYPISAMVPSVMPAAPAVTNDEKTSTTKVQTQTVPASGEVRVTSDRVNAFLATDQSSQSNRSRPDGPPPPPPNGAGGPNGAAASQSGALDEAETALSLLEDIETEEEDSDDETVDDTGSEILSILFEDDETYQPSSFY